MTIDNPEPVDPVLAMRASDADRERVAAVLRDAFVEGRLSSSEHEERLTAAYAAATVGALVPVLTDLPVPRGTLPVPENPGVDLANRSSSTQALSVRPDLVYQSDGDAIAVFGGFERRGRWVVPPRLKAMCVFGGGELDLTKAQLTSQETVLKVRCVFGGLEIIVPEGMAVRDGMTAVFGGHSSPAAAAPDGAPVLRIEGIAVFGGVETRRPRKPKGGSDPALER
jgi:Domain of unknown function (DUF1707)/Cell wall-active antibiotics response 4TMS YvqF